jgi:anti-sigma B factor antagonist
MKIDVQQTDQQITITLNGDLDLSSAEPAREEFVKQIDESHGRRVIVDMSHVRYLDSGGLSALVNALKESREKSVYFALAGVNTKVREVLGVSRLDRILNFVDA